MARISPKNVEAIYTLNVYIRGRFCLVSLTENVIKVGLVSLTVLSLGSQLLFVVEISAAFTGNRSILPSPSANTGKTPTRYV